MVTLKTFVDQAQLICEAACPRPDEIAELRRMGSELYPDGYKEAERTPELLYCDECGAELQRESCNHVRACSTCTSKVSDEYFNVLTRIKKLGKEAYDYFHKDIAEAPDWPTTKQRMEVAHLVGIIEQEATKILANCHPPLENLLKEGEPNG